MDVYKPTVMDGYKPTEAEVAWMAGLFDGEGCISIRPDSKSAVLSIEMADLDLLERFRRFAGCGTVLPVRRKKSILHKNLYTWNIGKKLDVQRLLLLMNPWFGERRQDKVAEALAHMI